MSDDKDYMEKHLYGARLLLENLWQHVSDEFPEPQDTKKLISLLLDDITKFYEEHVCEECVLELDGEDEPEPSGPGVVLPFKPIKKKDWSEN